MADSERDRSRETDAAEQYEPTPRWVKFLLVVGALLALAVLVTLLASGDHGPGRHLGLPAAIAPSR